MQTCNFSLSLAHTHVVFCSISNRNRPTVLADIKHDQVFSFKNMVHHMFDDFRLSVKVLLIFSTLFSA